MSNTKTCLVLGANGFIGSHLVDELVEGGYKLRAIDRPNKTPKFKSSPQIELLTGDISDKGFLAKALNGIDYVFHCFSATTPASSDDDPYTDIDRNIKQSVQIFEECVEAKVKKIIFLSSGGATYGHIAEERPAREEDAATPVSPYGISKLAIENYLAYFNRKHGMEYIVYRLSNPYGPRQAFRNSQGVIPAFLQQATGKGSLSVFGDGSASRDYVYIRDVTRMIAESFAKQTQYPIYNLGSGTQTTINQLIEALKKALAKDLPVTYQEAPKTYLKNTAMSVERFTKEFGDHATTSLVEGLHETLRAAQ